MNEEFQPRNEILNEIDDIFLAEMDKGTMAELANRYEKGSKDTTFENVLKPLGGDLSKRILSLRKINDYTVLSCSVDVSADVFPLEIDPDYFFAWVTLDLKIKHDKEVDGWIVKVTKRSHFKRGSNKWHATSLVTTDRAFKYHRVADDEGQTTGSSNRTDDASTSQTPTRSSTYGETLSAFTNPTENQTN